MGLPCATALRPARSPPCRDSRKQPAGSTAAPTRVPRALGPRLAAARTRESPSAPLPFVPVAAGLIRASTVLHEVPGRERRHAVMHPRLRCTCLFAAEVVQ